jgi:hypothetical protein
MAHSLTGWWTIVYVLILIDLMVIGVCLTIFPWIPVMIITLLYSLVSLLIFFSLRQCLIPTDPQTPLSQALPIPALIEYPIVFGFGYPDGTYRLDSTVIPLRSPV